MKSKQYRRSDLIEWLRDLYNEWGDTLASTIDRCADMPCSCTYSDRFGSLENAREIAGVERRKHDVTREKAVAKLRDVERESGMAEYTILPSWITDMDESVPELRSEAGLIFTDLNSGHNSSKILMIEEMRNLRNLGIYADKEAVDKYTNYSYSEYKYIFGISDARRMSGYNNHMNRQESVWNRFGEYYTFEDWARENESYDSSANFYVYRISIGEDTFYVGQTVDLKRRIGTHSSRNKINMENANSLYVESVDSKHEAKERERELFFETAIEFDTENVYGGK